jgi:hypothetical protein
MTRRQISARAFDEEHKRLMHAARNARGGLKGSAQKKLVLYVAEMMGSSLRVDDDAAHPSPAASQRSA